jgi:hypothetical protein
MATETNKVNCRIGGCKTAVIGVAIIKRLLDYRYPSHGEYYRVVVTTGIGTAYMYWVQFPALADAEKASMDAWDGVELYRPRQWKRIPANWSGD